jgi:ribosomal protein S4
MQVVHAQSSSVEQESLEYFGKKKVRTRISPPFLATDSLGNRAEKKQKMKKRTKRSRGLRYGHCASVFRAHYGRNLQRVRSLLPFRAPRSGGEGFENKAQKASSLQKISWSGVGRYVFQKFSKIFKTF